MPESKAQCPYCQHEWTPRREVQSVQACPACRIRFSPHSNFSTSKPVIVLVAS
jgi:ribosomal protein L37AE/L43A